MGKIQLKSSKSASVVEPGLVDPKHEVISINNEERLEIIDLSTISGWGDLTIDKQRYLVEFSRSRLKEKRSALTTGVPTDKLREWKKTDGLFIKVFEDIIDLHMEGIEEVDYVAAFSPSNNTSRGRVLNNRSKQYNKEEETNKPALPQIGTQNNQTNIFNILNSEDVTSKGLAGVQEVFNKLKSKNEVQPDK